MFQPLPNRRISSSGCSDNNEIVCERIAMLNNSEFRTCVAYSGALKKVKVSVRLAQIVKKDIT